jgi:hypothetical protein
MLIGDDQGDIQPDELPVFYLKAALLANISFHISHFQPVA